MGQKKTSFHRSMLAFGLGLYSFLSMCSYGYEAMVVSWNTLTTSPSQELISNTARVLMPLFAELAKYDPSQWMKFVPLLPLIGAVIAGLGTFVGGLIVNFPIFCMAIILNNEDDSDDVETLVIGGFFTLILRLPLYVWLLALTGYAIWYCFNFSELSSEQTAEAANSQEANIEVNT